MGFDERVIDQVLTAADIVEIISERVPLKKAGTNFKGLCPFHQEKTPSFMVSPQKQIFHCFGCGVGGNVFSFLTKYEHVNFPEAVRLLAERCRIALPEKEGTARTYASKNNVIFSLYEAAAAYYQQLLLRSDVGGEARAYLRKRALSDETIAYFSLGFSSETWRGLYDFLIKKGFSQAVIAESGLVLHGRDSWYDFFRGRLIFPIWNSKGKLVAFGGRTLKNEQPKYINTPETEFFRKRYELYGLHWAKHEAERAGRHLILVEGYIDVMRLVQAGIKNVVATLGTALTREHLGQLRRFCDKVTVIFDSDQAGIEASIRSFTIFLEENMCVTSVVLPEGHDPDTYVRDFGASAFRSLVDSAPDFFDFKMDRLFERYDRTDSYGIVKITGEMLETVRLVTNTVLRDHYIQRCARRLGIHEISLRDELKKLEKKKKAVVQEAVTSPSRIPHLFREELSVLRGMIENRQWIPQAMEVLDADDFERLDTREIFTVLKNLYEKQQSTDDYRLIAARLISDTAKATVSELPFVVSDAEMKSDELRRRLSEMQQRRHHRALRVIQDAIKNAEKTRDHSQLSVLQQRLLEEKRKIQAIQTNAAFSV